MNNVSYLRSDELEIQQQHDSCIILIQTISVPNKRLTIGIKCIKTCIVSRNSDQGLSKTMLGEIWFIKKRSHTFMNTQLYENNINEMLF